MIGDKYAPLIDLWNQIIETPGSITKEYEEIWRNQLDNPKEYYLRVRDDFNKSNNPAQFLYLVARCVKNSIRFNSAGEFNQSADNRRLGMKPERFSVAAHKASQLLAGRTLAVSGDFMEIIQAAGENDLVYLDPPWQGTSLKRDPRYAYLLDLDALIAGLNTLNERNVPYMLSFDGLCGEKKYGTSLPSYLNLEKRLLQAGRSSQATLLGRQDVTVESLYLSPALITKNRSDFKRTTQQALFT